MLKRPKNKAAVIVPTSRAHLFEHPHNNIITLTHIYAYSRVSAVSLFVPMNAVSLLCRYISVLSALTEPKLSPDVHTCGRSCLKCQNNVELAYHRCNVFYNDVFVPQEEHAHNDTDIQGRTTIFYRLYFTKCEVSMVETRRMLLVHVIDVYLVPVSLSIRMKSCAVHGQRPARNN